MKKFLSICLVALCSVSAMYAQTASTESRTEVPYTTNVSVEATSKTGFYHFVEWQIKNGGNTLGIIAKDGTVSQGNGYEATVSTQPTVDGTGNADGTGRETSTLTLNPLGCDLVNAATSRTVTFEAIFDIDSYTIEGTTEGGGSVEFNNNGTNTGTTTGDVAVTLTATTTDNCSEFDHWVDVETGATVPGKSDNEPHILVVTPQATWAHNSTHTYKAVFGPKKVTITVTTADDQKGTVKILAPAAPQQ